jgi:hypothetical protein
MLALFFPVLMMDTVNKSNFSSLEIPKFDNIVQKSTYDDETHVELPSVVLFSEQSVAGKTQLILSCVFMFLLFKQPCSQ